MTDSATRIVSRVIIAAAIVASALVLAFSVAVARDAGPPPRHAGDKPLAPLIGTRRVDIVRPGDTLLDVAERHRLGFERIARLNPQLDVWIPTVGARVLLPTEHVLPDVAHEGLVVNLPELQLYDFAVDPQRPEVFALAIGDEMDPSLIGEFRVGRKRSNPTWHVPASIRAERPELPAAVAPGPDNPLGPYWMTIGSTSYGIHGTNNRWSIGREATHGCLRLYNDEVARLFARTPTGAKLRLVYQPVKIGWRAGILYVEAHPDRYQREPDRGERTIERLYALGVRDPEALGRAHSAIEAARGEPIAIAVLPEPESTALPPAVRADGARTGRSATSKPIF